ncbi:spermidine/putrescine ABC transporter permease [Weissella viridescens]|uniref:spermidine/putrescine ABC transporter permease n=1 Tax=Weissella viridescens TaxID=1629 RepID=UPI001746A7D8|nr:spermidine/putrescine ABC transporter permease [Weissella viridescens]QOD85542.1 spermidine/putrescine ABC transporter permease [Weissella viridescens]WJI90650.1 spermidine/putrescine ABC transporter permease [Weissella viridescens]
MNILLKLVRIFSWIAIILNTLMWVALFGMSYLAYGDTDGVVTFFKLVFKTFFENPFNFSLGDNALIFTSIAVYIISIILLITVRPKKN